MNAPIEVPRSAPLPRPLRTLVEDARARWHAGSTAAPGSASEALAAAMCREALRIAYQPIVALDDQRLVAVEALVRLPDPGHEELATPSAVIAVAETSGLIRALGAEVLAHACSQLATWRSRAHLAELQMHVNVSPLQLRDERFVELVERTLRITGVPASALVVEITETAAFERDGRAEAALATLATIGVEISIDDFGTGFASLERLASTPARSIKLDRSFVGSVGSVTAPPRGRALVVQAAIGLGHALGLRVVAEGIETAAQARTLRAWGCLYGQGYHFARPDALPTMVLHAPTPPADVRPAVWERSPHLSPDAIDLALAIAIVAATADPRSGTIRADAQELALELAEVLGLDRRQADTAALLATIADAPQRFAGLVTTRSPVPAAVELARVLGARGGLGRAAAPGPVAAAARRLAMARRDGSTVEQALQTRGSALDPATRARIVAWWERAEPSPSPLRELRAMERRLRSRDDATRRLRALSALTHAIGGAGSLVDVLDVTAEEARVALGASSLSISRLDRELSELRTLVNVGEVPGWQQRRPVDESYPLTDFPVAMARLMDRAVHLALRSSETTEDHEARHLEEIDKGSSAAVPIVVDNVTWGEVFATTAAGAPPFTPADTPFLSAIANVVSLAIQRSEHVDQLARLADEDPLTRIANRRALERWLAAALAVDATRTDTAPCEVGLLLLDVNGLNEINARRGHAEGDRALVRVGDVIARIALTRPGTFAARLGGDEFCIVLDGSAEVDELFARIQARLADGPSPQPTVTAGFAAGRPGSVSVTELLHRADAAQYLAKRTGVPIAMVGPDGHIPEPEVLPATAAATDRTRPAGRATDAALRRWSDTLADRSLRHRLEGLGEAAGTLLDLNRWIISEHLPAAGTVTTKGVHVRRRRRRSPEFRSSNDGEFFLLTDYPATAAALRDDIGFSVHVDDAAADPGERALLTELGQCYVVAIPAQDGGRQWLLELYGDEYSTLLDEARPVVEALASRTLDGEVACPALPAHDPA